MCNQAIPETPSTPIEDVARRPDITTPPAGYEGVPSELWPDADGNPPVVTEALIKKLRGKYFTVRHVTLNDCGHKLDMINQPKGNCENCWWQFFQTHPQLVEVADQFFRTQGKKPMIGMRGEKFVKNFLRYMSTVIHLMKQEGRIDDAGNPINPGSTAGESNRGEAEAAIRAGDAGSSQATDQGREIESSGISSGLIQHEGQ